MEQKYNVAMVSPFLNVKSKERQSVNLKTMGEFAWKINKHVYVCVYKITDSPSESVSYFVGGSYQGV